MEVMSREDRTMLPAAVVPAYQSGFVRAIAELDERPLAYFTRLAFDLLIAHIRATNPKLFERVVRKMSPEDRDSLESTFRDSEADAS